VILSKITRPEDTFGKLVTRVFIEKNEGRLCECDHMTEQRREAARIAVAAMTARRGAPPIRRLDVLAGTSSTELVDAEQALGSAICLSAFAARRTAVNRGSACGKWQL